ncbi:sorting nexin-29 [Bacillus rossius redtenbacheri]|uniref:sorting nexin-29 n=1 Tax=Bacillus rossius redtenbacheri TaxID=93214 RepID=UPI002FDD08E3
MMSAVVPGGAGPDAAHYELRQRLLAELLDAVKQCQIRFGGRTELATDADPRVAVLCARLELALAHGLRPRPLSKGGSALRQVTEIVSSSLHLGRGSGADQQVFWHYVHEHLTRHEIERYLMLKNVWTDSGRGRAWLRSALNECSLERYLHSMLANPAHLRVFYEDWAFLLDQEKSSMLPVMAAGLGSILFAISIDNTDLNQGVSCNGGSDPLMVPNLTRSEPIIASSAPDPGPKRRSELRRRKKIPTHIISFDNEELERGGIGASSSAPPTCLNSPAPDSAVQVVLEAVGAGGCDQAQAAEEECIGSTEMRIDRPFTDRPQKGSSRLKIDCSSAPGKESRNQAQTLTPVNNVSVGELIPVSCGDEAHSEEDSLSVPSYSEDTDCAAAALLATQKLLQTNYIDFHPTADSSRPVVDLGTFVNGELIQGEVREAVLALVTCKERLQSEAGRLRRQLDQVQEEAVELRAELEATRRQHRERTERTEARVQSLLRENELLKHQLRKYVAAVQMLKKDGSQAHEALSSLEASQPRDQGSYPDYHYEAQEYERKLIQVAEMHGELMEFNERLHRLLQQKDAALHRLREELVDLRGPLPDDGATSDDDLSVTSDYDTSSLCAAVRALVNIWVPSAFLTGGSSDVHHVYQVYIRIRDDEWNIYRRYAQFYSLHKELKKQDAVVGTFDFPPKKTIGNKDSRFVEERRRRLQHYLRCIMNHLVQTNMDLATAPDKDLLISLVPFFGELCSVEDKSRRKRGVSRNPFSRLGGNGNSRGGSPQYTGL